jgi:RNA polymerase sigma-70 factor, ECF subfamily
MSVASATFSARRITDPGLAAEESLVQRLRDGDPEAMGELYDRFGRAVFAIALRMVRNSATAEDLVQETFIRIWNGIGLFDRSRGSLAAWVGAIARNRVLDYVRSSDFRAIHSACELRKADSHVASPNPAFKGDPISAELARAVRRLDTNHRRVLEMAFLEGMTQSEIAARLQRPLGTVKTWARVALKSLRETCGSAQ